MDFSYDEERTGKIMNRTTILIVSILCTAASSVFPQLTIEDCWKKAAEHYPLSSQLELLQNNEHIDITNANLKYLPQISVSGKSTAQTDVMQLPIKIPGIEQISKDQYAGAVEVNQTIWDGGITRSQKSISSASSQVDKKKLAVDIYALNDRVNKLFFGILLTNEQLMQNKIFQDELQTNYQRFLSLMQNGLANQADLDVIKVELLNAGQRRIELSSVLRTYQEMLSEMTGELICDSVILIKPDCNILTSDYNSIQRPEIGLFNAQEGLFLNQKNALVAGVCPKISLFGQGLMGRPGLSQFENDFSGWFVAGIRLGWDLGGFYSLKNNYAKINNNVELIKKQKETFLFNTKLQIIQQKNEIDKFRDILKSDDEIIALRKNVKKASEAKVENGTISVTDLIKDINEENLAIQGKSLHEIQLLMSIYNLKNTINN